MTTDDFLLAVVGKSESQFDLNRDLNVSCDSVWPLKIPLGFDLFEADSFRAKSHNNECGRRTCFVAKFTSSVAQQSSAHYNSGEDVVYFSQPAASDPPRR